MFVYTCTESDGPEILAPEDAKAAMVENTTNLTTDIVGITQSDGADALIELINLTNLADPFNGRSSLNRSEAYVLLKEKEPKKDTIGLEKSLEDYIYTVAHSNGTGKIVEKSI